MFQVFSLELELEKLSTHQSVELSLCFSPVKLKDVILMGQKTTDALQILLIRHQQYCSKVEECQKSSLSSGASRF